MKALRRHGSGKRFSCRPRMLLFALSVCAITSTLVMAGCAKAQVKSSWEGNKMEQKAIGDVLKQHTDELMSIPGVVGTAQGLCSEKPCIKIFVVKKTPALEEKIPKMLEGYPVSVEESGEVRPLSGNRK